MSTLATLDDVKRVLRAVPPSSLLPRITIGSGDTDTITDADAQAFLDAAEDELKLMLGFTPKKTSFVTDLVARMAACRIIYSVLMYSATGAVPEHLRIGICESAERDLDRIMRGEIVLEPETSGELIPPLGVLSSQVREVWWEEVTLDGTDFSQLDYFNILQGSVRVYSDRSQTTQYTEGTDYQIIYTTGEIRRLPGSSISDGAKVYVCYSYIDRGTYYRRPDRIDYQDRLQDTGDVY